MVVADLRGAVGPGYAEECCGAEDGNDDYGCQHRLCRNLLNIA